MLCRILTTTSNFLASQVAMKKCQQINANRLGVGDLGGGGRRGAANRRSFQIDLEAGGKGARGLGTE